MQKQTSSLQKSSLLQYHKDNLNDNLTDSESFKCKARIIGKTSAACKTKDFKIAAQLNHLSISVLTLSLQNNRGLTKKLKLVFKQTNKQTNN